MYSHHFPDAIERHSAVVIVSSKGTVVSIDSKSIRYGANFSVIGESSESKFVILQNRFIVAVVGLSDLKLPTSHFNFLTWMKGLQFGLQPSDTVDYLATIIEDKTAKAFSGFDLKVLLKTGKFKQQYPPELQTCYSLVQFIIVGVYHGAVRIYKVEIDLNGNDESLIGPTKALLFPQGTETGFAKVIGFGMEEAIRDIGNRNSYAYQQAMAICPKATAVFLRGSVTPTLK